MSRSVHKYFKKSFEEMLILVQLDPLNLKGVELLVSKDGQVIRTERTFDEDIYEDLEADEFESGSPLEFNLYLKKLV